MTEEEIILSKIAEEAGELAQAAMKAQKYGLKNVTGTKGSASKMQIIAEEFIDVMYAIGKLIEHSEDFSAITDRLMDDNNQEKIRDEKWATMLDKCRLKNENT